MKASFQHTEFHSNPFCDLSVYSPHLVEPPVPSRALPSDLRCQETQWVSGPSQTRNIMPTLRDRGTGPLGVVTVDSLGRPRADVTAMHCIIEQEGVKLNRKVFILSTSSSGAPSAMFTTVQVCHKVRQRVTFPGWASSFDSIHAVTRPEGIDTASEACKDADSESACELGANLAFPTD